MGGGRWALQFYVIWGPLLLGWAWVQVVLGQRPGSMRLPGLPGQHTARNHR